MPNSYTLGKHFESNSCNVSLPADGMIMPVKCCAMRFV
jgi:hypothetical protein